MIRILLCYVVLLLLLYFLTSTGITNPDAWGQTEVMSEHVGENHAAGMNGNRDGPLEQLIPSITEWTGVFSLGMFSGLFVFNTNVRRSDDDKYFETKTRRRDTTISIAVLSIPVGIIHVLLVPEHLK